MRDEVKKPVTAPASRSRRVAVWGLVIVILAGLGYYFFAAPWNSAQRAQRTRTGEGPVPVIVAAVKRADVPLYLDAVGTSRALNTVTVRPQVDGKLITVQTGGKRSVRSYRSFRVSYAWRKVSTTVVARPDTPGARPDFSVLPGTGGSGTAPDSSAEVPEPNESHATDLTVHEKPRPVPTR